MCCSAWTAWSTSGQSTLGAWRIANIESEAETIPLESRHRESGSGRKGIGFSPLCIARRCVQRFRHWLQRVQQDIIAMRSYLFD